MKTRILDALAIAILIALAITSVVSADNGSGTGTLTAKGDGLAAMRGNISVALTGSGWLVIRDEGGDAKIEVKGNGYRKELPGGAIAYIGFNGRAEISGSNISIALRGKNVKLEATGTGKFLLRGHGTYHTEKQDGEWSDQGQVVTLN